MYRLIIAAILCTLLGSYISMASAKGCQWQQQKSHCGFTGGSLVCKKPARINQNNHHN